MIKKIVIVSLFASVLFANFSKVGEKELSLVQSIIPTTKIEKVKRAGFGGFYEAYLANGNILYVSPYDRVIFAGNAFTNKGFNLTSKHQRAWKDELDDKLLMDANKSTLIEAANKVVYGDDSDFYNFVIFTDPQCPGCIDIEHSFRENNSTVYFNFFPLKSIHRYAEKLSLQTISSKDFKHSLSLFGKKTTDINVTITDDAKKQLGEMLEVAKRFNVHGTPRVFVIEKDSNKVVDVFTGSDRPKVLKYSVKEKIDAKK